METHKNLPVHAFATFAEVLAWMEKHHAASNGIWIKFAKKSSGIPSITYEEAREAAIIHGWIDGLKNALDENYYLLRFTPRRPKGAWSKINCEIVEKLIAEGRMHPAGEAQVLAAKSDGRWDAAYDSPSNSVVPEDLQARLDTNPEAKAFFESISKANRYSFLYRIQTAKTAATRERHIKKAIEMLAEGRTYHPETKSKVESNK